MTVGALLTGIAAFILVYALLVRGLLRSGSRDKRRRSDRGSSAAPNDFINALMYLKPGLFLAFCMLRSIHSSLGHQ
jgi:hypothetical protein